MAFDMSRVALGFVGGALSGYDTMLKAKMQEEYQQKREEAIYNREKNLMEQQAKISQEWALRPDNPENMRIMQDISTSKTQQEYVGKNYQLNVEELKHRKLQDERSYNLDVRRTAAAESAAAASRAAAAFSRDVDALRLKSAELEYNMKADPTGYTANIISKNGALYEQKLLESGQGEEEAKALRAVYELKQVPGVADKKDISDDILKSLAPKAVDAVKGLSNEEVETSFMAVSPGVKYPGRALAEGPIIRATLAQQVDAVTGAGGSGVIPQTSKQEVGKDKTLLEKQTVASTAVNFYTNLSRIPRDEWSSEDIANLEEVNNQMQKHLNPEEQRAVVKMAKKKAPGAFEILSKELGRLRPTDTSSTTLGENPWSSPRKK